MTFITCNAVSFGCGFCIKKHLTCEDFIWLIVVVVVAAIVVVVSVASLPVGLVFACEVANALS